MIEKGLPHIVVFFFDVAAPCLDTFAAFQQNAGLFFLFSLNLPCLYNPQKIHPSSVVMLFYLSCYHHFSDRKWLRQAAMIKLFICFLYILPFLPQHDWFLFHQIVSVDEASTPVLFVVLNTPLSRMGTTLFLRFLFAADFFPIRYF